MRGIQKQAFLTIKIVAILTLGLGLAGWYGLYQTSRTISDFEAKNLPEMSTALGLSEDVARLAALAPYVASSAQPFQLQSERKRLETRFYDLNAVAKTLKVSDFRRDLLVRLSKLQLSIIELIDHIKEELFLREDMLSARFIMSDLENQKEVLEINQKGVPLDFLSLLRFLLDQEDKPLASQKELIKKALKLINSDTLSPKVVAPITKLANRIVDIRSRTKVIKQRKTYLLALIRAQSEQLTEQVNIFVEHLQMDVVKQRKRVQSTVSDANILMLVSVFLLMFGMLNHYIFNHRMIRDLSQVTKDMLKLADGDTKADSVAVQREDEIGELARAYHVFRNHSLKVQEVSNDLTQQKDLLETVFNHINDGLSVFSPKGELLSWNKRFLEILNFSEDEVYVNQPLHELQKFMDREPHEFRTLANDPVDILVMNALRHNRPLTFERRYISGKIVEFRSQPMPDGGFVTLYSDLTDRKAIEAQLHQAQKMEMLGQLTGGVAHDFNNLLAAVMANLQLLTSSEGLTDKQQKYAERSLNVTEKGTTLVQRLLAFSRRQQLFPQHLNVDALIQEMIDLVEYSIAPNIKISTKLNIKDCVFVDPSQLENAILNLAINSSAALPFGGNIVLKTEHHLISGSTEKFVAIIVEDDGHGIPFEIQERILEPFYTTKPAGQGSGMGLSLVYGFVKQSGGDMLIKSNPGQGAQVTLLLPIVNKTNLSKPESLNQMIKPIIISENKKILLVEDNPQVRQVIPEQIESLKIETISVASAEAALEVLDKESQQLALVLTDISLTGALSGVDLKDKIDEEWPEIEVVMTSGLPRDALEQFYGLKSNDFVIPKPISFSTLKRLLDQKI